MRAALVTSFTSPPRCSELPEPVANGKHERVVHVLAAGLHPRVRSQADGSHYTSDATLPLVPGIDGVGRDDDGQLRYFVLPDTTLGSMAERTVIDLRRSLALPEGTDPVKLAAAMNPAMGPWLALHRRIAFTPGQKLMVLGATGNAGEMAVQLAQRLGASQIVAVGRDAGKLAALRERGATDIVALGGDAAEEARRLGAAAADVDVVLDFVWGEATARAMVALVTARTDGEKPLRWIEIGSVGGPTLTLPSAALRAARLEVMGSGQGSIATSSIVAELPALAVALKDGRLAVETETRPLTDVEQAWKDAGASRRRIVIVP